LPSRSELHSDGMRTPWRRSSTSSADLCCCMVRRPRAVHLGEEGGREAEGRQEPRSQRGDMAAVGGDLRRDGLTRTPSSMRSGWPVPAPGGGSRRRPLGLADARDSVGAEGIGWVG
jgi:hypothetical protein